jgi:hypothetical protein
MVYTRLDMHGSLDRVSVALRSIYLILADMAIWKAVWVTFFGGEILSIGIDECSRGF